MNPTPENQWDAWLALTGQIPSAGKIVTLPMLTGSMVPAIPVGTQLNIVVNPDRNCRTGEVVVFQEDDRLIAHRILLVVALGPWRLLLEKGDANRTGRWRRGRAIRGQVESATLPGHNAATSPTSVRLARLSLRNHWRNWIAGLIPGGRR